MAKEKLKHHRFKLSLGLWHMTKVIVCKSVGHELNSNPNHNWCERCGLCHEEIYPDYFNRFEKF